MNERDEFREKLAELCHEQWSGWMEYLFEKYYENNDGSPMVSAELDKRWYRQMVTPYKDLSEAEKDSDRNEADKFLKLLEGRDE